MAARFILEADGGSRGNPGPAGSGALVVAAESGQVVAELGRFVGVATNNVAEYIALDIGLQAIFEIDEQAEVEVRMDSKLVVEQMSGRWKIKHPDMQDLAISIRRLIGSRKVKFSWVPREQNSRADALANEAMDTVADFSRFYSEERGAYSTPVNEQRLSKPSSIRAPEISSANATTLILVRHGRTELTESNRVSGSGGEDPALSVAGRQDAERVARELAQIGHSGQWLNLIRPSVIVTSPLARTRETARIIAENLGLDFEVSNNFAEISFGDWDGHTNEEIISQWPCEYEQWRGSWEVAPPNGESLSDFDDRIRAGIEELLARHAGQTVIVVAHVMPVRGVLKTALNAGPETYWSAAVAPCSISAFRFWDLPVADLLAFNSTSHLV